MKIALIILNYNLKSIMLDCLASVSQVVGADDLEIVVVDNNSTDGSVAALEAAYPAITLLKNSDNLGFAGGNNVGIGYAVKRRFDYIVVLNPDVLVDPDFLSALVSGFDSPTVGITAPKVYFAKGFEFHKDRYKPEDLGRVIWFAGGIMDWNNIIGHHRGVDEVDHGQYDDARPIEYASGNCMMVKREVFEKIGLFDERYFLYYEDVDFCMRAKKAGFMIQYQPKAIVWHKNAQASGGSGNALQDYFISRNRLLFGFSYASFRAKIALFRESVRNLFSYRTRRQGTIDFYLRRFGKGSYLA